MKKITSILMLFLMYWGMVMQAAPTDLPELSTADNIKWYTINAAYRGGCLTYDATNDVVLHVDFQRANSLWYFMQEGDSIAMYNAVGGKLRHNLKCKDPAEKNYGWYFHEHTYHMPNETEVQGLVISKSENVPSGDHVCLDASKVQGGIGFWAPAPGDFEGTTWSFVPYSPQDSILADVTAIREHNGYVGNEYVSEVDYRSLTELLQKQSLSAADIQQAYGYITHVLGISETKTYVIKSADSRFTTGEKAWYANSSDCRWATLDPKDKSYFFQFEKVSEVAGGYRIKSCVAADTYVGYQTEGKLKLITTADQFAAAIFSLQELGDFKYLIRINPQDVNPAVYVNAEGHLSGKGEKGDLVSYNVESDLASMWYIVEAQFDDANSVDVTYNYEFNGELVHTETISQAIGSAFKVPLKYKNGVMNYELVAQGTVSKENCKAEINCTEKLPFEKTTDLGAPIWYAVEMGRQNNYMTVSGNSVELKNIASEKDIVENFVQPNCQWCFEGDVVHGFKIYNYTNGTKQALALTTDEKVNLVEPNSAIVWELKWIGYNSVGHCFVNGDKYLGINTNGNGIEGITFGSGCDARFYKSVDKVKDIAGKYNIAPAGAVGSYSYLNTLENRKAYKEAYDAYCADPSKGTDLVKVFNDMVVTKKNEFNANSYYRIKNYKRICKGVTNVDKLGAGGYISTSPYPTLETNTELTCATDKLTDAGAIWQFEKSGDGYRLKNLNSGKYIGHADNRTPKKYITMQENYNSAGVYQLQNCYDVLYLLDCSGNKLHPSGGNFIYYYESDMASYWYLVPATELDVYLINNKGASWAALYLPFDVTLPEDLSAYIGKRNGNVFSMKKVPDSKTVPANNGVILKGQEVPMTIDDRFTQYTLEIKPATEQKLDNQLVGTNVVMDINKAGRDNLFFFGVGYKSGVVGFYRCDPNIAYLKQNKAYLEDSAVPANVLSIDFNSEPTGIEDVELKATDANAVYYDLSGRRVEKPMKGIYIKNGKKIIVK